ncbi:MAG: hypothetical protein GX891_01470 [Clostridiales bacterium]|nr:hypothetical protein [Clostridiales bacterium]
MSFSNSANNERKPGTIVGNPLYGLCEKVCIQVNKVFDACLSQVTEENSIVTVTNPVPPNPTLPLTFISAKSTSASGIVESLTITPLSDRQGYSRVQAEIGIPIEVIYVDANGIEGKGTAIYTVYKDVVMLVPENSVIPVTLAATVNLVAPSGTYLSDMTFSITACVTIVLKIEAEVELLVPSYGYCQIPACQDFSEEVCAGVFDLPLFPTLNNKI